ncbi:MAG: hypothetical protein HYR73_00340 [Candidatus Eisenbacteria bacterium]|nr:hypothetical protein [Candidatus Eisenbacteria bacterium]
MKNPTLESRRARASAPRGASAPARGILPRSSRAWRGFLACGIILLAAGVARGSDTQWWITNQAADFTRAEARGVVVRPDGVAELGPRAESWRADSLGVIWAALPLPDGSVALAGDRGHIDRWTASLGVRPWVRLPVGQVLSLAADGTGLVAGTGPEGLIYRVGAGGDTSLLARTGERYVWAIARAPRAGWYAATGTHGRLFLIEGGKARVVLDCDVSNLVSILADGMGGVFTGGDSHGRVIHVLADGASRTVFDASEDEVRALAFGPDGALYAAALSSPAVSTSGGGAVLTASAAGSGSGPEADDDGAVPLSSAAGGRAVLYRIVPDSSVTSWWTSPQNAVFAAAGDPAGVLAASGNRAGVYRVTGANAASALFMAPQGQVTALALAGGAIYAATSNPAALWRLGPGRSERGELLSSTFDARRMSRFGRMIWFGAGPRVALSTRSGNTDPPDTTWSPWQGGDVPPEGARIESPPARYLQWKLALTKPDQQVSAVETSWRVINQPPRIENIIVAPQGQSFREGELQPRIEPVTQNLPGGQKVEYSISAPGAPRSLRSLPAWARGLRTVQWRTTDPDGDALKFKVERRAEGATDWIKIVDDLDSPAFTWDTNPLPDGRYRVRVTATDAPSNAVGEERTVVAESPPFTIDNTPPRIAALNVNAESGAIRIEGEAEDPGGRLSQLDVALDEGDWRPLTPDAGLTDDPRAAFHARLPGIAPGEHTVSVRATDFAGNVTTRAARVSVPRGR